MLTLQPSKKIDKLARRQNISRNLFDENSCAHKLLEIDLQHLDLIQV
jgi:hypothetical protein